ncbi:MAG TPA: MFS transporter [Candidatus Polarisedimenticolia bacterium]|nr:MFS transporter [Candidatus Polarisedimenticolia bacterium]
MKSARFAVAALSLAYLLAMVDRLVLSLLVEPIKSDLALSDAQIGSLAGLAFGLFYTVMGIPIGRLADRVHRPKLIAVGVLLWSLATMGCGLATTFGRLFATRVLVGVGEASISPAAYSLIADLVPRDKLGRALSVYMLGTVVGLGVAWIAGGQALHLLTGPGALPVHLAGGLAPWQMVFILVGLPGLLVAPLVLLIAEPRRNRGAAPAPAGLAGLAAVRDQLRKHGAAYTAHFIGMAAVNTYGFALVTWAPAMFRRSFGWPADQVGTVLGGAVLVAGVVGMLASGQIVDALTQRRRPDAPFRILFLGTALLAPVAMAGPFLAGGWARTFLFVAPAMGLFFAVVACAPTSLQVITPASLRSSISSVYLFIVNIVAFAVGPLAVGWMSDRLGRSDGNLALALAVLGAVCLPAGALAFGAGLAPFRRATLAASTVEGAAPVEVFPLDSKVTTS